GCLRFSHLANTPWSASDPGSLPTCIAPFTVHFARFAHNAHATEPAIDSRAARELACVVAEHECLIEYPPPVLARPQPRRQLAGCKRCLEDYLKLASVSAHGPGPQNGMSASAGIAANAGLRSSSSARATMLRYLPRLPSFTPPAS